MGSVSALCAPFNIIRCLCNIVKKCLYLQIVIVPITKTVRNTYIYH